MIGVVERVGTVAELHALDPFADHAEVVPAVWWCRPTDDAIVLGSRQDAALVDQAAARRAGLSVVLRRSGGGAVIIRRSAVHWVDVVLPSGFASDDVRASMVWIGEHWRSVLRERVDRELDVHAGAMQCSTWSDLVCFTGVGPGEVLVDGAKLVGLSQRRTRRGIRVQALVYDSSVAGEYRRILRGDLPPTEPEGQAWQQGLDGRDLAEALAARLAPI